jgi:hypothetical protein
MSNACNKPERLTAEGLAQAAARGVERAMEARRAAGVELSGADINEVSGGAAGNLAAALIYIRGIPAPEPYLNSIVANPAVNPAGNVALPTAGLTAGF